MGNQWGGTFTFASPTKMLGGRVPPIIAAPAQQSHSVTITDDSLQMQAYVQRQ